MVPTISSFAVKAANLRGMCSWIRPMDLLPRTGSLSRIQITRAGTGSIPEAPITTFILMEEMRPITAITSRQDGRIRPRPSCLHLFRSAALLIPGTMELSRKRPLIHRRGQKPIPAGSAARQRQKRLTSCSLHPLPGQLSRVSPNGFIRGQPLSRKSKLS